MGTWSSSLYGNDTTCDVRDTYIGFLEDGLSNDEAYEKTLDAMKETLEDDEAPLFWYALAETQWKVGRLRPEVREKALEWIEKGGGMEPWLETKSKGSGWQKTLDKLKEKLNSPMGKEKKVRKRVKPDQNFWAMNDVYAYRFPEGVESCAHLAGKYMVLQKMGEGEYVDLGIRMRVHIFNRVFDQLPTLEELDGAPLLPLMGRIEHGRELLIMSSFMSLWRKKDYPKEAMTFLGNRPAPINKLAYKSDYVASLSWRNIYEWLAEYYDAWKDGRYTEVEDGIYAKLKK